MPGSEKQHKFWKMWRENKMKKIAVASDYSMVTEHFGHCSGFMVFETEKNEIQRVETIANPGHRPGFLPNFLSGLGVTTIISGGMGGGAVEIFNKKNIEVVVGAVGRAEDAVIGYLAGSLKSTGSICHQHQHHEECGES